MSAFIHNLAINLALMRQLFLVIHMFYGDNLKILRTSEDISQEHLAKLIGVDKSLYSRYEKEIQLIPIKHLITLCNYFNVSLDYIFGFSSDQCYAEIIENPTTNHLKQFRKEMKITQDKLAKFLNTTHSVISDYERGRYLIATPFLYQICAKYRVSADYLLGRIENPKYFK